MRDSFFHAFRGCYQVKTPDAGIGEIRNSSSAQAPSDGQPASEYRTMHDANLANTPVEGAAEEEDRVAAAADAAKESSD